MDTSLIVICDGCGLNHADKIKYYISKKNKLMIEEMKNNKDSKDDKYEKNLTDANNKFNKNFISFNNLFFLENSIYKPCCRKLFNSNY